MPEGTFPGKKAITVEELVSGATVSPSLSSLGITPPLGKRKVLLSEFYKEEPVTREGEAISKEPQFKEPPEEDITNVDKMFRSFRVGGASLVDLAGGAAIWAGLDETGDKFRDWAQEVVKNNELKEMYKEFEWSDLADPDFYMTKGVQMIPSLLTLIPVAIGGGAIGGGIAGVLKLGQIGRVLVPAVASALASRPLESAMEAAGTFNKLMDEGHTKEEASEGGAETFVKNITLLGFDAAQYAVAMSLVPSALRPALSRFIKTKGMKAVGFAGASASEGVEEVLQNFFQDLGEQSIKKDFDPSLKEALLLTRPQDKEAAALGTLAGAAFQTTGIIARAGEREMPVLDLEKLRATKEKTVSEAIMPYIAPEEKAVFTFVDTRYQEIGFIRDKIRAAFPEITNKEAEASAALVAGSAEYKKMSVAEFMGTYLEGFERINPQEITKEMAERWRVLTSEDKVRMEVLRGKLLDSEEELVGFERLELLLLERRNAIAHMDMPEGGKAIIRAFQAIDVEVLVHELGHMFRRLLNPADLEIAEKWAGVEDGKWSLENEEMFANAFTRWLRTGKTKNPKVVSIFKEFKSWLTKIYKTIKGSRIDIKVSTEMKEVFDKMVGMPDASEIAAGQDILKDIEEGKVELDVAVEKQVILTEARGNFARLVAVKHGVNSKDARKRLKVARDRERAVIDAIEHPEEREALSDNERRYMDLVRENWRAGARMAQDEQMLQTVLENYVYHIYRDSDSKIKSAFYPVGVGMLKMRPRFSLKRMISTLREAEEKFGLTPVDDIPTLITAWWSSLGRAMANRDLVQFLKTLPTQDGAPILSAEKIEGYRFIAEPSLARAYHFGKTTFRGSGVWVHPEFYEPLSIVLAPPTLHPRWIKEVIRARNTVKRLIMVNPLIHGWNIYSDTMDEYNFRIFRAARVLIAGEKEEILLKRAGVDTMEELKMDAVKNGLSTASVRAAIRELYEGMGEEFPELKSRLDKIKHPLKGMKELSDWVLWGKIVQNASLAIYALKKAKFMKTGISPDRAGYLSSHFTNDLLGTLMKSIFTRRQSAMLSALFFARNWTVSNLRLVTGALGYRGGKLPLVGKLPRFLAHKGLTKEDMRILQAEYAKHLVKGVLGLVIMTNIVTYAITGHWSDDNEEGHKMDIDLGFKDKKGREVYITPMVFRYIRDYFGWFGEPIRTFMNKTEPLLRQTAEQLFNFSYWRKRPIAPGGAPWADKFKLRAEYFFKGITPLGTFAPRRGEVRTWTEALVPLIGTWIRHGVSGGDIGLKIIEFMQEKGYKQDKIDEELNEMIQSGDIYGFLHEAISTGRYKQMAGIKRRLLRFKSPLVYRFKSMSREDRIKFLMSLTEEEKKKMNKYLKAGSK